MATSDPSGQGDIPDPILQNSSSNKPDEYFQSYDSLEVHELMLKDRPRTLAYKRYIEENTQLFKDKIVLDVGAGTGILSMFAAKAGAKKVYAIEASDISQVCKVLVEHNELTHVIEVINSPVESFTLPVNIKADILISEWMGFYLLHESMLASIVNARDRLLCQEGLILPSSATIYICPVTMKEHFKENFLFWQDVYGFDFSPVLPAVQEKRMSKPEIIHLSEANLLSSPELVTHLEIQYVEMEDLREIIGTFAFNMEKNGVLHGFACWFDVGFDGDANVKLSTGPAAEETHWKQTVVLLPQPLLVNQGEELNCNLAMIQDSSRPRSYNISVGIPDEDTDDDVDDDVDEEENMIDGNDVHELLSNAMASSDLL